MTIPFGAGIVTPYHGPWSGGMRRVFARGRMDLAKVMIPAGFGVVPAHVEHLIGDGAKHIILRTEDAGITPDSVWHDLYARGFTDLPHIYPQIDWWIQVGNEPSRYYNKPTPSDYRSQLINVYDGLHNQSELAGFRWMAGTPITKEFGDAYFSGTGITSRYDAHAVNLYGYWNIGDTGSEAQDQYERALSSTIPIWIAETGIDGDLTDSEKAKRILSFYNNLSSRVHGFTLFTLGEDTSWSSLEIRESHAQVFAGRDGKRTRWFSTTGYQMADPLLTYWENEGGLSRFGYPISGELVEDGYLMQYTERTRLEYHPQNSPGWQILLGHLGRYVFDDEYRVIWREYA